MKIKTYIILFFILCSMSFIYVGCQQDFLKVNPKESVSENSFFKTKSDAIKGINATYASLQPGIYSQWYAKTVQGAAGGYILNNTTQTYIASYSWPVSLGTTDTIWQSCYEGIMRANLVLENVPNIDMDSSIKKRILGEAHFLRALYYWHLMVLFGGVPIVKKAYPNDPSKAELSRSKPSEVVKFMIKDLKKAEDMLPITYNDANIGRATKGAAQAMLGKVYLYGASDLFGGEKSYYSLAAKELKKVIDLANSGVYHLVSYQDLWVVDNNPETIFEVQYAQTGGGIWANGPSGGANETNLRPVLNLPNGHGGNGNLLPTQRLVDIFEKYNGPDPKGVFRGRDPRLYYSIYRDGDLFYNGNHYKASWSPTGYAMKKGLFPVVNVSEDGSARNIPILRLGGVYLMYAEAVNAKDNRNPSIAIKYLNKIRDRVNMPNYPTADYPCNNKKEIFKAIVHERQVELVEEYQRYNDLRRWGLAKEVLGSLGFVAPRDLLFPIPPAELDNNPKLTQNPGY